MVPKPELDNENVLNERERRRDVGSFDDKDGGDNNNSNTEAWHEQEDLTTALSGIDGPTAVELRRRSMVQALTDQKAGGGLRADDDAALIRALVALGEGTFIN